MNESYVISRRLRQKTPKNLKTTAEGRDIWLNNMEGKVMEYVTLNNGVKMPILGFGVYQIENLKECEHAVSEAIQTVIA